MKEGKAFQPHNLATMVYLLYLLGILFGITALIGVIVNHTHLKKTRGTYAHSHFIWQIISFWTLFALAVVAFVLLPAKTMMYIALLWWISSASIGIGFLIKKQPMPFFKSHNL